LETTENPKEITIRKIAEIAGVGVGLINYHFSSRDQLVSEAISLKINLLAVDMEMAEDETDAVMHLKNTLVKISDLVMRDIRLSKIPVEYDLLHGDFHICLTLLPILRQIFLGKKTEEEMRMIAFELIVITQMIYIRQEAFHLYSGVNVERKKERDQLLNNLVDRLIFFEN
jgi:AcrR family transcriptional regulator